MKKGFTLVELLIVIGILAILTAAVVVVLNPAQLLAQARDSQRMSDLSSLRSAITLYLATASVPDVTYGVTGATSTVSIATTSCPFSQTPCSAVSSTVITGAGWVLVKLDDTSGGSPLSALPLDPTSSGYYFYAYTAEDTNNTFEINAKLESSKYRTNMTTDGGNKNTCSTYLEDTCYYEIGTHPALDL